MSSNERCMTCCMQIIIMMFEKKKRESRALLKRISWFIPGLEVITITIFILSQVSHDSPALPYFVASVLLVASSCQFLRRFLLLEYPFRGQKLHTLCISFLCLDVRREGCKSKIGTEWVDSTLAFLSNANVCWLPLKVEREVDVMTSKLVFLFMSSQLQETLGIKMIPK